MKKIIKAEIFKLVHRREFYIILSLLLLSFGLPFGFKLAPASYAVNYSFGDGRLPQIAYMVLGYAFWGTLGVFILLFSMLSASLSSQELESHYFYLYFPRVQSRSKVYISKYLVLISFVLIWYLSYTLVLNPYGHRVLCSFRPDIAVRIMSDESFRYWFCMWLMNLAELVFYISLSLALGMKLKPLPTISVVMVIYYLSAFIYDFPLIRYLMPEYYRQTAMSCKDMVDFEKTLPYIVIYLVLTLIYDVVLFFYGKNKICKINA